MKSILAVFSGLILFSVSGFASGKTLVVCNGATANSGLEKVVIHQDVGGQLVALYTTESVGGSYPTFAFKVVQVPVASGNLGAGLTFAGKTLVLHVNTDVPRNQYAGFLSIKGMPVKNEQLSCRVNFR